MGDFTRPARGFPHEEALFAPSLTAGFLLLLRVTFNALKHRDVAEIHRVSEGLVRFVAEVALVIRQRAEIDGMFKRTSLNILFSRSS